MAENTERARDCDAVLGGQNTAPAGGVVLGGIEGVKQRLNNAIAEQRVAALTEALKYGQQGLELIIQALQDSSKQVSEAAHSLLEKQAHPRAMLALRTYRIQQLPKRYAAGVRDFKSLDLYGAKLIKANLSGINLNDANLTGADLINANLSEASLRGTDLSRANLNLADLSRADLYGANLRLALLIGASLSGASLGWANLSNADLGNTDLSNANLNDANLSKASLNNANLKSAKLKGADLRGATYNAATVFPKGFSPGDAGAIYPN